MISAQIYNYNSHGLDWPKIFPDCQGDYQSPIDLKSTKNKDSNLLRNLIINTNMIYNFYDMMTLIYTL